jgi:hypothetical protein
MNAKSALLEAQSSFMAQVLDEGQSAPENWNARQSAGMDIYRQNYRSAVVEAVSSTYEQTCLWLGNAAFKRAAIHHVIAHPPVGWTIDDAGADFDATCAQVFGNAPEVSELAWLEWAMLIASRSADAESLTPEGFAAATAQFGDDDWAAMTMQFLPGASARTLNHDLHAMWQAIAREPFSKPETKMAQPRGCIVWREEERPTFLMVDADQARAFNAAQQGQTYGEICVMLASTDGSEPDERALHNAAMAAGAMLGQWLGEGLLLNVQAS